MCKVNAGEHSKGGPLQIVCGAPNARVGIKVPLALVGAQLPAGEDGQPFEIKLGKLRGVESHGMLCSARELKLSDEHAGLLELDSDASVGADIRHVLSLDDTLFTLKLTPNLAHALCVYGIAREVAALTGAPLHTPAIQPVWPQHDRKLPVQIEAPDLCGRFSGRIVRNINTRAKTPRWMADRLERCGQRSVSALVDISNYVMFEYGRPSHIFDLDKIRGGLTVRWGRKGETLELLNGSTITNDTAGIGTITAGKFINASGGRISEQTAGATLFVTPLVTNASGLGTAAPLVINNDSTLDVQANVTAGAVRSNASSSTTLTKTGSGMLDLFDQDLEGMWDLSARAADGGLADQLAQQHVLGLV